MKYRLNKTRFFSVLIIIFLLLAIGFLFVPIRYYKNYDYWQNTLEALGGYYWISIIGFFIAIILIVINVIVIAKNDFRDLTPILIGVLLFIFICLFVTMLIMGLTLNLNAPKGMV